MKQIDRDVKRIVTLREQYSSLKVILLVNISLPSFQTTGNDLETVSCFQGCPRGTLGEYKTFPSAALLRVEAAQP